MSLSDEDASLVDGLGETTLEDEGLESSLEETGNTQTQYVIELVLVLGKDAVVVEAAEESSSLEDSLGVMLVQGKQLTGSLSHLGDLEVHSPDLALVLKAVLSDKLHLGIKSLLLERTSGSLEGLAEVPRHGGYLYDKDKKRAGRSDSAVFSESLGVFSLWLNPPNNRLMIIITFKSKFESYESSLPIFSTPQCSARGSLALGSRKFFWEVGSHME